MTYLISSALSWLVAISWHLWRILTLRTAYSHLSDTKVTIGSFFVVFFAAGLLRWGFSVATLTGLVLHAIVATAMLERSYRNSSVVAAVLGCSVVVDLMAFAAGGLSLASNEELRIGWLSLEVILIANTVHQFFKQPAEVQRSGYRRKTA